jgi:V8-like Glu-specific endopeptidase
MTMKRKILVPLIALVLLLVSVMPVGAVTDGQLDGEGHPYVGLMLFKATDGYYYTCSGTLLSPTVFLTAGHCTSDAVYPIYIWFDANPISSDGLLHRSSADAIGTPNAPTNYNFPRFDVGVVVLDNPVVMDEYGQLPNPNQLDVLKTKRGLQNVTFTAVGYGMQKSFPTAASWKDQIDYQRWVAYPKLNQINVPGFTGDFSMLLSNNTKTGGTCFGDSGGPNFLGNSNVVAGVTSFGINGNCAGTGGVFRLDKQDVLDFVNSFLTP